MEILWLSGLDQLDGGMIWLYYCSSLYENISNCEAIKQFNICREPVTVYIKNVPLELCAVLGGALGRALGSGFTVVDLVGGTVGLGGYFPSTSRPP